MLKRIEDITVISGEEFHSYTDEMIFVDTVCPFKQQPLTQAFIGISDAEEELPALWQEISLYGGDIFLTFENDTVHTFISTDFKEQLDVEKFLFIKVIAIGDAQDTRPFRIA